MDILMVCLIIFIIYSLIDLISIVGFSDKISGLFLIISSSISILLFIKLGIQLMKYCIKADMDGSVLAVSGILTVFVLFVLGCLCLFYVGIRLFVNEYELNDLKAVLTMIVLFYVDLTVYKLLFVCLKDEAELSSGLSVKSTSLFKAINCVFGKLSVGIQLVILILISLFLIVDVVITLKYMRKGIYMFPLVVIKGLLLHHHVRKHNRLHKGLSTICQNCYKEIEQFDCECSGCKSVQRDVKPTFAFPKHMICFECGEKIGVRDDIDNGKSFDGSLNQMVRVCRYCGTKMNKFSKISAKQCIVTVVGNDSISHRRFTQSIISEFCGGYAIREKYIVDFETVKLSKGRNSEEMYTLSKNQCMKEKYVEDIGFEFAARAYHKDSKMKSMILHVYNINTKENMDNNQTKVIATRNKQNIYVIYSKENFTGVVGRVLEMFRMSNDVQQINNKFNVSIHVLIDRNEVILNCREEDFIKENNENEWNMLAINFMSVVYESFGNLKDIIRTCEADIKPGLEYIK